MTRKRFLFLLIKSDASTCQSTFSKETKIFLLLIDSEVVAAKIRNGYVHLIK